MKRAIAMVFGLCFALMWLGCGMGEDEAWSDEDGVVPNDETEGITGEDPDGLQLRGQWPPDDDGPAIDEPIPDPITRPEDVEDVIKRGGW